MRSRVGLCVLGLLCLHSSVFVQALDVQPGVLIFCDDPSVQKAVDSALNKFNEGTSSVHKLALYQILTASKSENGSDSVYSLQFTSRRSDCPTGSNKPWTECNYLHYENQKPLSCNATVYMTETEADTKQVDCQLDDYIIPLRAPCLGCPENIDENSEDLRVPVLFSLNAYNSKSDSTHLFTLHTVDHATRQVIAGFRYKVRFDMTKTVCAKAEHKELSELCVPDNENAEFVNCNSTVDVAPWRFEGPDGHVECEPGALPMMFNRRRPAGWSPLRNFLFQVRSATPSPSPSPSQPPSLPPTAATKDAKDESSEEDSTASNPSVSPDEAVNDNPFHCPSEPWKPFNPDQSAPTKATTEEATPEPSAGGGFSDTDLLG